MHTLWKGSISFGLVNIPIKMHSMSKENELKFVMLHKKDMSQIRYAHMCKTEEKEVPWEEIVKGYEYEPGEFVVLDKQDFDNIHLEKSKSIEILSFVAEDEIDSIYYVKPYFLVPEKNSIKAYSLLVDALKKSKKVGIAKYVYHNREYLAIMKSYENVIVINQLRFAEELIAIPKDESPKIVKPSSAELEMAVQLINQLTATFKPGDYHSSYREEVKEIIEQKAKGKKIHPKGQESKPTKVHDIMALLKASLEKKPKKQKADKTVKKGSKKTA